MSHIIEGFEGDKCILEVEGKTRNIPRDQVDAGVKVGDVVEWNGSKWVADAEATRQRAERIRKLMDAVWEEDE